MKVNFDVDSYKAAFTGGLKQYLFYALIQTPKTPLKASNDNANPLNVITKIFSSVGYGSSINYMPYLVRSTTLPESIFEEIVIPYVGHPYKMAGVKTYGDWTLSFNVDSEGRLLKDMYDWQNKIYDSKTQEYGVPNTYMFTQDLFLVNGMGDDVIHIQLEKAWPKSIGSVSLDYSSTEIATVEVTFSYQSYKFKDFNKKTDTLLKSALNKLTSSGISLPRF